MKYFFGGLGEMRNKGCVLKFSRTQRLSSCCSVWSTSLCRKWPPPRTPSSPSTLSMTFPTRLGLSTWTSHTSNTSTARLRKARPTIHSCAIVHQWETFLLHTMVDPYLPPRQQEHFPSFAHFTLLFFPLTTCLFLDVPRDRP